MDSTTMAKMKQDNQEDQDILEFAPSAINVAAYASKRADEINTMMQALEGPRKGKRIFQRLPRHMRRRAMSHNVKRLPRSMRCQGEKEMNKSKPAQKREHGDNEDGEPAKKKSRRHRRRPSNLRSEFNRRQRRFIWLETHLWHAKRFKMEDRWGHRIPLHSNEKGVRAAYRAVVKHCLMQDISYYGAVELMGTQEKILIVMNRITNIETGINISEERYLNGSHHGRAVLYKKGEYPYGAIGPADFMWNAIEKDGRIPPDGSMRQLWLWLHPACYDDAFEEIKRVCSKDDTEGIEVNDLRADLVRFHFEGPLSHSVLIDTLELADVTCSSDEKEERRWWENVYLDPDKLVAFQEQSTLWEGMSVVQAATEFDSNCIIALTVRDPRHLLPKKRGQVVIDPAKLEPTRTSRRLHERASWSPIWDQNVRKEVKATKISQHKINQMRSEQLVPGTPLNLGRQESRIPVLILQNTGYQPPSGGKHCKPHFGILGYGAGWDVVLPSGWGMEFWVAFYYRGARVGARREASSSRLQQGTPEFPLDFPDTQSGKLYAENLQSELVTNYMKKPPAKRLNYSKVGTENPFVHPWCQLVSYWKDEIKQGDINDGMKDAIEEKKKVELMEWTPSTEKTNLFVLRNIQYLNQLQMQCVGKVFERSKTLQQCLGVKVQHVKTDSESMQTYSAAGGKITNIPSPLPKEILLKLKFSLVFVTMRMVNRGAPSMFAMICLPSEEDLNTLEGNPSSPGPIEPKHKGSQTPRLGKKSKYVKKQKALQDDKCKGGDEIDGKGKQSELDEEVIRTLQTSSSEQLTSMTHINCCSRTIIGYVTNGAHAFSTGVGCSVGLCSLVGLSKLLRQKVPQKNAAVLIRDAACLQYRYAYINISSITN